MCGLSGDTQQRKPASFISPPARLMLQLWRRSQVQPVLLISSSSTNAPALNLLDSHLCPLFWGCKHEECMIELWQSHEEQKDKGSIKGELSLLMLHYWLLPPPLSGVIQRLFWRLFDWKCDSGDFTRSAINLRKENILNKVDCGCFAGLRDVQFTRALCLFRLTSELTLIKKQYHS